MLMVSSRVMSAVRRGVIFLRSGQASLARSSRSDGRFEPTFARVAQALNGVPGPVVVTGHTDNKPIHNAQFGDNWELSTARATELVRLLITKYGFTPDRLSAAGYAEYHPVTDNDSNESRAQNRRVDLVILGRVSSNKLLAGHPGIATGAEGASSSRATTNMEESSAPDKPKPSLATLVREPVAAQ